MPLELAIGVVAMVVGAILGAVVAHVGAVSVRRQIAVVKALDVLEGRIPVAWAEDAARSLRREFDPLGRITPHPPAALCEPHMPRVRWR